MKKHPSPPPVLLSSPPPSFQCLVSLSFSFLDALRLRLRAIIAGPGHRFRDVRVRGRVSVLGPSVLLAKDLGVQAS